jgi:hypothetical protein
MAFFCQSMQRTALIRQTLKRPAMGDDGIFLSVNAANSAYTPDAEASGYGRDNGIFLSVNAANSANTPDAEAPGDGRRWHFLSVISCGLQPAANSANTPDAEASGYGRDNGIFLSVNAANSANTPDAEASGYG